MSKIRIGCFGPAGKWERIQWYDFIKYAADKGVDVVIVDLTKPIDPQGPFSLIVHKMTFSMTGHDMTVNPELDALHRYIQSHPEIPVVDDLDAVAVTLNREEMTAKMAQIQWPSDIRASLPGSAVLEKSDTVNDILEVVKDLHFPILAKPSSACSTTAAHMMRLATTPEQLLGVPTPCVLQEYINHGGIVYKIYALGDHLEVGARPSMRNIEPGECINLDFHSQHSQDDNGLWTRPRDLSSVEMPMHDFQKMSRVIREHMDLSLIGFDILIDQDKKYWLVDLNYFPGYKNVDNLWEKFLGFFLEKCQKK